MTNIEQWMRGIETTLVEHDRRIRSKPAADPSLGFPPTGPAGGHLTGTYPNPSIAAGVVTGGAGGIIADGTITHVDVATANKDGAAATPSMRTLGTGAQQAAAGNDARLSDARTPTAHVHSGADITSGTVNIARLPTGTSGTTVAFGSHTHTLDAITAGGVLTPPLTQQRIATPGSVPAGAQALYPKADGYYYVVDSTGVERPLIPKPDQLHLNPSLDAVAASTVGNSVTGVVAPRLMPTGWSWYWASGAVSPTLVSDDIETLYGVGRSVKVTLTGGTDQGQAVSSSVFGVVAGGLLTVSAWIKGTGPRVQLLILTNTSSNAPDFFQPGTYTATSPDSVPGSTWQKVTHSAIVPAGHTQARLMLRAASDGVGGVGSVWFDESESSLLMTPPASVVTGEIKMWPAATAPTGYLLCQGGTFDSATYPALATLLGDTYGTHSGTTYYLPDFRGRSPLGVGTASPAVAGGTAHTLAQKGGEEKHTLTVPELAAHVHGPGAGNYFIHGDPIPGGAPGAYDSAVTAVSAQTATTGSSTPFNVLSPYLGINFIIKT